MCGFWRRSIGRAARAVEAADEVEDGLAGLKPLLVVVFAVFAVPRLTTFQKVDDSVDDDAS